MMFDRDFHGLHGMSDRYFDNLHKQYEKPDVDSHPRQVEDNDILPTCEFNTTAWKRNPLTLWKKSLVSEVCGALARWVVYLDIDECRTNKNFSHDHLIMTCEKHSSSFSNKDITNFDCPELLQPSPTYTVKSIEKL